MTLEALTTSAPEIAKQTNSIGELLLHPIRTVAHYSDNFLADAIDAAQTNPALARTLQTAAEFTDKLNQILIDPLSQIDPKKLAWATITGAVIGALILPIPLQALGFKKASVGENFKNDNAFASVWGAFLGGVVFAGINAIDQYTNGGFIKMAKRAGSFINRANAEKLWDQIETTLNQIGQ